MPAMFAHNASARGANTIRPRQPPVTTQKNIGYRQTGAIP